MWNGVVSQDYLNINDRIQDIFTWEENCNDVCETLCLCYVILGLHI